MKAMASHHAPLVLPQIGQQARRVLPVGARAARSIEGKGARIAAGGAWGTIPMVVSTEDCAHARPASSARPRLAQPPRAGTQGHSPARRLQRQRRYFWRLGDGATGLGRRRAARALHPGPHGHRGSQRDHLQTARACRAICCRSSRTSRASATRRSRWRWKPTPSACPSQGRYIKVTEAMLTFVAIDDEGEPCRCPAPDCAH